MILCLLLALQAQPAPKLHRPYWLVPVDSVATTKHTHVHVRGKITLRRHEQDGDTHYKIIGKHSFIVAECIPELPCNNFNVGDVVDVYGISREDKEHGWWEVHPAECISIGPTCGPRLQIEWQRK